MYKTSYLERVSRKSERYSAQHGTSPWKACFRFWLWSIAQMFYFPRAMRPKADETCRVGFWLTGGIGDVLVALNYLQNLHKRFDGAFDLDVYVRNKRGLHETVKTLCRDQDFVKQVLPLSKLKRDYDLYIKMVRYVEIISFNKTKIGKLYPAFHQWCLTINEFHKEHPIAFRYSTHGDYIGNKLAVLQGRNRLQQADIGEIVKVESIFQPKIVVDKHETFAKFSLENKRFITIQRGVGAGDRNDSTRLWPLEYYETLVRLIKERVPEVCVVQVGTLRNTPISGIDVDLRGKTTFDEIMVLMREADCHVDGECGLVHLRHFLRGGPSVVLFGPTEKQFYGYEENINIQSDACEGGCEWITPEYAQKCPRGFTENVCLTSLMPETVLEHILEAGIFVRRPGSF